MSEAMKQAFGLVRRPWGIYYLKNKANGEQKSLKTTDKHEAQRILQAHNEAESQPHFNLSLARVYLNGADPKLATRTWQDVMENIVEKKAGETRRRWETAIKDKNLDCIRNLAVCETRPEHFNRALSDSKVSTNVYLRRIHNHALGMEWLLKSVIPRLLWPKPVYKDKRAITRELGIKGVTLHSYRYAWAERAKVAGYPERFAQEALGHNSRAVHQAYAKRALVKIPSLQEYEERSTAKAQAVT